MPTTSHATEYPRRTRHLAKSGLPVSKIRLTRFQNQACPVFKLGRPDFFISQLSSFNFQLPQKRAAVTPEEVAAAVICTNEGAAMRNSPR